MMTIEYHGWIALSTSQKDWDEGDLQEAFEQVRQLLDAVPMEENHAVTMVDSMFPRIVYMSGRDVESSDEAVSLMKQVAQIFDRSYGELAVCDLGGDSWVPSRVKRVLLIDGQVRE